MQLSEQIVLVTGGARGVGAAVIRAFAREGARVVINFRAREDAARELVDEFPEQAVAFRADVTDREAVHEMVALAEDVFG